MLQAKARYCKRCLGDSHATEYFRQPDVFGLELSNSSKGPSPSTALIAVL